MSLNGWGKDAVASKMKTLKPSGTLRLGVEPGQGSKVREEACGKSMRTQEKEEEEEDSFVVIELEPSTINIQFSQAPTTSAQLRLKQARDRQDALDILQITNTRSLLHSPSPCRTAPAPAAPSASLGHAMQPASTHKLDVSSPARRPREKCKQAATQRQPGRLSGRKISLVDAPQVKEGGGPDKKVVVAKLGVREEKAQQVYSKIKLRVRDSRLAVTGNLAETSSQSSPLPSHTDAKESPEAEAGETSASSEDSEDSEEWLPEDLKEGAADGQTHRPLSPLTCVGCKKRFVDRDLFWSHPCLRSGSKPHKLTCGMCGSRYQRQNGLQRHILRQHVEEEPELKQRFQCSHCDKSFSRSDTLKHHLRLHTGEKLCSCAKCGKKFSLPCQLRQHQLMCKKSNGH